MSDTFIETMALMRKSRKASRRVKRGSRKASRRSKKQRGGEIMVLKCSLDAANKVIVEGALPAGITVDNTVPNTLKVTTTVAVNDVAFAGPPGPVNPRVLGTGTGIMIDHAKGSLIPGGFLSVLRGPLTTTQRKLNSTMPYMGLMTIRNLNTANLGLSATDRKFTITLKTPPDV